MENSLSLSNRLQLEAAYKMVTDKRSAIKINVLLLLDDSYTSEEVSSILRIDKSTVNRYLQLFLKNDLNVYLRNSFSGGVSKLNDIDIETLEKYLEANICESTDQIIDYVAINFNIRYTRSGMASLLKRLGFVFKKPILVPGKSDSSEQEAFINYYFEIKNSMGADDKLYFLDGVHPQFNSVASYGWIKKGKEKQLKTNTGRRRVNLNGALNPDSMEVIIRADDTLNAQSTINLFKMIEQSNKEANKIVLIVDNAPYYYNGDVVQYINDSSQLEIVYLPPYSPNLNLIERLWGFMKRTVLHNKYYETFSEFKNSIGDFFLTLPNRYISLESLLVEDFQRLKIDT